MMRLMLAGLVLIGAVVAQPASGAVLTGTATNLTGATGVQVGSLGLFDVTFVDGSCDSLFDGCSVFPFDTIDDATAASFALLDQVFQDTNNLGGAFSSNPSLTNGCANPFSCRVFTPVASLGGVVGASAAINLASGADAVELQDFPASFVTVRNGMTDGEVYAVWSPQASVGVPAPSALSLAALAVLVLMVRRRRGARDAQQ